MKDYKQMEGDFNTSDVGSTSEWNPEGPNILENGTPAVEDYALAESSRNNTAMILLAVCIVSMIAVWFFGIKQGPKEATAEQKEVEAQLDNQLARLMGDGQLEKAKEVFETKEMVKEFYDYPSKQQVNPDDLRKNPFARIGTSNGNSAHIALERKCRETLSLLALQSIMQGTGGAKCLINGEIFAPGQKIMDLFVIKSIGSDTVILGAENLEFQLQIQ